MSDGGMACRRRLGAYARLMRLDRPIGTVLLLCPALWALWAASDGVPPGFVLAVFAAGAFLTRSAGCAMNDFFDRDIDRRVERTRERPLAAGQVSPAEALVLAVLLLLTAFALVLLLNRPARLWALGALFLIVTYPSMKRVFPMPQVYLGLAFSWSVPMAFAAVTGDVPAGAWILFAASVCWTVAYDTLYGLADRRDDERLGLRSSAIVFGRNAMRWVMGLHGAALALLALYGAERLYPWWYYPLLLPPLALAVYQQSLPRSDEPIASHMRAFRNNGWFGAAVCVAFFLSA